MPGYQKLFFKGNPSKVNLPKDIELLYMHNSQLQFVSFNCSNCAHAVFKKFLVFKFIVKEIELLPQTRVAGVVTVVRL